MPALWVPGQRNSLTRSLQNSAAPLHHLPILSRDSLDNLISKKFTCSHLWAHSPWCDWRRSQARHQPGNARQDLGAREPLGPRSACQGSCLGGRRSAASCPRLRSQSSSQAASSPQRCPPAPPPSCRPRFQAPPFDSSLCRSTLAKWTRRFYWRSWRTRRRCPCQSRGLCLSTLRCGRLFLFWSPCLVVKVITNIIITFIEVVRWWMGWVMMTWRVCCSWFLGWFPEKVASKKTLLK